MIYINYDNNYIDYLLLEDNTTVFDVRSYTNYIGWNEKTRGGHIPGSIHIPNVTEKEIIKLIFQYNIPLDNNVIIVYSDDSINIINVLIRALKKIGYSNLYKLDIKNYIGNLKKYKNYNILVSTDWLFKNLNNEDIKIFHVSWKEAPKCIVEKRIPGSGHIDTNEFEKNTTWTKKTDEELFDFLKEHGIDKKSTVVLYGLNHLTSGEYKLYVILKYLGLEDVKILDGGWKKWIEEDKDTHCGGFKNKKRIREVYEINKNIKLYNFEDSVKMMENKNEYEFIDIRGWNQYVGLESGYDYLDVAGRIPGNSWLNMDLLFNSHHYMKSDIYLNQIFKRQGINLKKELYFYCGSASWGAAKIKFYMDLMGFDNVQIYEGGWFEWQYNKKEYLIGDDENYSYTGYRSVHSIFLYRGLEPDAYQLKDIKEAFSEIIGWEFKDIKNESLYRIENFNIDFVNKVLILTRLILRSVSKFNINVNNKKETLFNNFIKNLNKDINNINNRKYILKYLDIFLDDLLSTIYKMDNYEYM